VQINVTVYLKPLIYNNGKLFGSVSGNCEELENPISYEWNHFIEDCKFCAKEAGFVIVKTEEKTDTEKAECIITLDKNLSVVCDMRVSENPFDESFPEELKAKVTEVLNPICILNGTAKKADIDFCIEKVMVGNVEENSWEESMLRLYNALKFKNTYPQGSETMQNIFDTISLWEKLFEEADVEFFYEKEFDVELFKTCMREAYNWFFANDEINSFFDKAEEQLYTAICTYSNVEPLWSEADTFRATQRVAKDFARAIKNPEEIKIADRKMQLIRHPGNRRESVISCRPFRKIGIQDTLKVCQHIPVHLFPRNELAVVETEALVQQHLDIVTKQFLAMPVNIMSQLSLDALNNHQVLLPFPFRKMQRLCVMIREERIPFNLPAQ
jgi:hypothetical protein